MGRVNSLSEETRRGRATKDAFAQSLINRLNAGEEFADISVRMLANDCNVDRQTFYYHFKNINALAEYAYEREINRVLDLEKLSEIDKTEWKARARTVLASIEQSDAMRCTASPLIDEGLLWANITRRIERRLHEELDEQLSAYSIDEKARDASLRNLSLAISSIYIAWIRRETDESLDDMLDAVERMRNDFLAGIAKRHPRA